MNKSSSDIHNINTFYVVINILIKTPLYHPNIVQNLRKPINSTMSLQRYKFYMLLKSVWTKPSYNIKINNNILNKYSAQQYRCLSTFNNGNHYEKNNNVLNFSSFANTMFVAVTGGIIYHQVFDNENNNNNNNKITCADAAATDDNDNNNIQEEIENYVQHMKEKLEEIRVNTTKKLHLSKSAEKFLEPYRTVRVSRESPYVSSFAIVNVFDVLASFKYNNMNHRISVVEKGSNGDNNILYEVIIDTDTSFIIFKDKHSDTIRLQIYTEQIPNEQQINLILNAYNAAWGPDTFSNNGWGTIFQQQQQSWGKILSPSSRRKSMKDMFNINNDNNNNTNIDGVKEQLKSMGVTVYSHDDDDDPNNNNNNWSALAGYEHVKREVDDTVLLALKHPEEYLKIAKKTRKKFESNQPKAILFDGPPGTGKTTTARIIASETDVPLVYVPIESLMSKWYGEGEKTLAKIFDLCDTMGDAILFIDEVDALATSRSDKGMHEATRRLLSVLLRRIDGFQKAGRNTLTICATNRKEDLDSALISRFDLTVNFNLPNVKERFAIFKMYAKQLNDKDIGVLANLSTNMAGRDIKDVCLHAERKFASLKIRKQISNEEEAPNINHYKEALVTRINGNNMMYDNIGGNSNSMHSSNNSGVEM